MDKPKIEISSDGHTGKVVINGKDVSNMVCGLIYEHNAGLTPVLTLRISALDTKLITDALPELYAIGREVESVKTEVAKDEGA